jgi:hypothetical protein
MTREVSKKFRQEMNQYIYGLPGFILTSRFNNHTWSENTKYREQYPKFGCIYCSPERISLRVQMNQLVFVLEMNNENNRIMGIGMVRNRPYNNTFSVYENQNYHRYQYVGKSRIDRTEMSEKEETIMKVFDILCFTGNKHQKRGHGLKTFSLDMLFRCSKVMDLVDFVYKMFIQRSLITKSVDP